MNENNNQVLNNEPQVPVAPVEPVAPVQPIEQPAAPVAPAAPVEPVVPQAPVAPVAPAAPEAPQAPVAPEAPQAPVAPAAPAPENLTTVAPEAVENVPTSAAQAVAQPIESAPQTVEPTSNTTSGEDDSKNNILYGILAYGGFLSLILYFGIKPKNDFAQFHAKQGVNLFIMEITVSIFGGIIRYILSGILHVPFVGTLISLASTLLWVLSLIGLVYVFQNKKQELPIVGKIQIIK